MKISIVSRKGISMVPNCEIIIAFFEEVLKEMMACHILNSKLNALLRGCLIQYSMLMPHVPDNYFIL